MEKENFERSKTYINDESDKKLSDEKIGCVRFLVTSFHTLKSSASQ